jgi:hypothetical protein
MGTSNIAGMGSDPGGSVRMAFLEAKLMAETEAIATQAFVNSYLDRTSLDQSGHGFRTDHLRMT